MMGCMLYLTASRPNIMFSVCMCARFQANPKETHLIAIKRILSYLKHTPNIGLWYPKGAIFELVGYSDSDYAGCKVDRKSTSGGCHLLGRSLVSWSSKKQNSVALYMLCMLCTNFIHCRGCMLCTNFIHETNFARLWCSSRKGTSFVRQ